MFLFYKNKNTSLIKDQLIIYVVESITNQNMKKKRSIPSIVQMVVNVLWIPVYCCEHWGPFFPLAQPLGAGVGGAEEVDIIVSMLRCVRWCHEGKVNMDTEKTEDVGGRGSSDRGPPDAQEERT